MIWHVPERRFRASGGRQPPVHNPRRQGADAPRSPLREQTLGAVPTSSPPSWSSYSAISILARGSAELASGPIVESRFVGFQSVVGLEVITIDGGLGQEILRLRIGVQQLFHPEPQRGVGTAGLVQISRPRPPLSSRARRRRSIRPATDCSCRRSRPEGPYPQRDEFPRDPSSASRIVPRTLRVCSGRPVRGERGASAPCLLGTRQGADAPRSRFPGIGHREWDLTQTESRLRSEVRHGAIDVVIAEGGEVQRRPSFS